ncbi:hypothetical protein C2G38_2149285 [Gigaspora rosea]|uniref:Uncharacterized protein n=1 Tax=Gigaspora rosea TaxID=44941 RepID=A0A397U2M7_9GLOM|nr:hypothetical protein C2G38_2149285 [Gigaspora rosea]
MASSTDISRPYNLYDFTYNLSRQELNCGKNFTIIKGNIGELQVLDTLNKLPGRFFARFAIKYHGDGKIDIQGFYKSTHFLIQVKFMTKKFGESKEIEKFADIVKKYENTYGIFYCAGGQPDLIDYVGFDYIGTYEYEKMLKHFVLRDEFNCPTDMLFEKITEFVEAKHIYLPNDHIGIFLTSPANQDLIQNVSFKNIIVSYNKVTIKHDLYSYFKNEF